MYEEQNIKQLPKHWKWVKVGEVVTINPKIQNKEIIKTDLDVQFLPMKFVEEKNNKIHLTETRPFGELKKGSYTPFIDGDIIFAKVTPCMENGKVAIVHDLKNGMGFGSSEFHVLRCNNDTLNKYLFYFVVQDKFRNEAQNSMTGAVGLRRVPKEFIENYNIPLPQPRTQQAIVAKIEELFSELDKGIEQLKTAQQQLKTYRQSVLKWAFEGKLSEPGLTELKNEQNVIKQEILQSSHPASDNGELPKGWKWVKTKDVIDIINNGYTPTKEYLSEGNGEIPFIKVYNLNFDGTLNFKKNPTFIPNAIHAKDLKRSICFPGDVLINIVGPPLGKVSIVSNQYPEWNINQAIVMFRPNEKVLSKYISYFMQNSLTINWLENTSKATAGQWNVKVSTCREIPFPLCPIKEQFQIVQEIESRLSVADKMEESITHSLQQAEALRQSILKQAFEGKLTTPETSIASFTNPAKVIPMERKVLAGKIIHLFNDDRNFGLTKFQKTFFLIEHHIQAAYETDYLRDTAGPYDKSFTLAFRKEMEQEGWFIEEMKYRKTRFIVGENIGSLIKEYPIYFREKGKDITYVLQLLKDKTTHESELIATLYAVWNNRLIKKIPIKEENLVSDFFNWSPKKREEFQEEEIMDTYKWMKEVKLVPKGFGKVIE